MRIAYFSSEEFFKVLFEASIILEQLDSEVMLVIGNAAVEWISCYVHVLGFWVVRYQVKWQMTFYKSWFFQLFRSFFAQDIL